MRYYDLEVKYQARVPEGSKRLCDVNGCKLKADWTVEIGAVEYEKGTDQWLCQEHSDTALDDALRGDNDSQD